MELLTAAAPIAVLALHKKTKDQAVKEPPEPVYGGYANGRGEISLFGEALVYRINLKNQSVQQRPRLNAGAQARYDATPEGEAFEYGNKSFRRLSPEQIVEVCSSGSFRVTPRLI